MKYITIVMLFLMSPLIYAQGLFESASSDEQKKNEGLTLDLSGYGKGSAYIGFDNYDYTTAFGEVAFQGKVSNKNAFMFADVRLRDGNKFNEPFQEMQLKEAYAGYSGEKIDVLLGKQIVIWGRTDGFNPTNCITPSDYFFLTGDPDDQNLSNFMLRFKYRFTNQIELDLTAIPGYKPSLYRYELFDLGEDVSFANMSLPDQTFGNSTLAARLNFEFSKVGFSVSWFRGYNPEYGFNVQNIDFTTGSPVITNAPVPFLKNMFGADIAAPLGSWIIRGEFAYTKTSDLEDKMYIPNPDLHYVAGIEHSFKGFNTILQYIGKYTLDFTEMEEPTLDNPSDPLAQMQYASDLIIYESSLFNRKTFYQQKKTNHALALTINKAFSYDKWNIELTGLYNLTTEDYLIRPKISWDISDALTASAGCSYMAGKEKELFYYAGPVLNGAFFELKVNF
jgi:hypothetical protein